MTKIFNLKNLYNNCIVFACLFISVYHFILILNLSDSGLDITDEGYYLNWILNPHIYKSSISQFGFFYNPLFTLINENIENLRKINLTVNFLLSYCLIFLLIKPIVKPLKINVFQLQSLLISFSLFIFLSLLIFTPSYNSLTLQGLLVTAIGILFFENYIKLLGYITIGLGGWMVFMGKPSSAAILSVLVSVYFINNKNPIYSIFFLSILTIFLLFCTSIAIDGSPILFLERLLVDVSHYQYFGTSYSISELAKSIVTITANPGAQNNYAIFYTFLSMIFIFLFLYVSFFIKLKNTNQINLIKIIFILVFLLTLFLIKSNYIEFFFIFERYQRIQIFSLLLFSIFVILKLNYSNNLNYRKIFEYFNLKILILFILFPLTYAFGTNVNIIKKSLDAGFFYLLVSFIILIPFYLKDRQLNKIFSFIFIGIIITSIHINYRIEKPYRQSNSLTTNNYILEINKGNNLKLNEERVNFINNVKQIANEAGLIKGNYILDLTGQSPGIIYLLNSYSLGSPWMIGNKYGGLKYAESKLSLENCEKISKSWILYDLGSRTISLELLNTYGSNFFTDYKEIGKWKSVGYGNDQVQKLLKPKNPNEIYKNCINKRNSLK